MRVIYCPPLARELNDQLNLNGSMNFIMKTARKYQRFQPLGVEQCEKCKSRARAYHHIKPIWAHTLQWLLDQNIQNLHELCEAERQFYRNAKQYAFWHDKSNLMLLCAKCHKTTQSEIDLQCKNHFEANYPVIFGYRRLNDQLALLEKY